ncbi:MAG: RIP metalloprotease RseP [Bacteroidetes bacterium]|nr:RIP metalloprotease RseP [Bacteroidota bacterium]
MEILIKASQLILSLSILVVLHELGHFATAKWFKMRVEKFYLFFDPWISLFKIKKGDTEYGIGWIPLGGYVKIAGMIDESMDKEQMKLPPQDWEFRSKPAWQRLIVMVGGVLMNLILAMCIYAMLLFVFGEKYLPTANMKDGIWCMDSLANEIGFQNGDKILSIGNKQVEKFQDIVPEMMYATTVQIDRKGEKINLTIPKNFIEQIIDQKGKRSPLFYPRIPFYLSGFSDASPAEKAGLKKMDQIIGLNDSEFKYFDEFKSMVSPFKNQTIKLKIKRGNEILNIPVLVDTGGKIGVSPAMMDLKSLREAGIYEFSVTKYGFFESFPAGIRKASDKLVDYVHQFKLIFNFKTGAYKGVGSFISIGNLFAPTWDWQSFWELTAILSIVLAFMNILPIPALDGGHVMFLLYEVITGKKPSDKFLEYAQYVGMFLLILLMVYAIGNDIFRLF